MKFIKKYKWEIIIFLIFTLSRLPGLGHDMFNTDVWKWRSRTYDFSTGVFTLDFEKTIQKYHPGVSLMWIGSASIKLFNLYHEVAKGAPPADNLVETVFALHTVQKIMVVLVLGVLLGFILHPLRKMFGDKYAFIATFLIVVEPLYVALTRVIHLEGLMSTFMIASFVWFYYYLQERNYKKLALSSFFGAAAFLTKTSSAFLIPFFGLVLLVNLFNTQRDSEENFGVNLKDSVKTYLLWLLPTIFFFVILWPAMLTNAKLALETLYRGVFTIGIERDHPQLYLGNWVNDPGPFYYLVVFVYRSSLWLVAGLIGFVAFIKKLKLDKKKKDFIIYALLFALFYIIELSIPTKKLDRYIMPAILSLVLVSSFFFEYLYDILSEKFRYGKQAFVVSTLLLSLGTLLYLHPYYLSYYSPLLGGLRNGIYDIEPKWMIGQREVVAYFEDKLEEGNLEAYTPEESLDSNINTMEIENKLTIGFQEKYYTQIWPFIAEIGGRATIKDITIHAQNSNYFVYPVYDDDSSLEDRVDIKYEDTIKLRGVDLYNVYKRVY
ncbi:ArnT family glycosyltransferase [Patescibacteria group bacterium]